MALSPLFAVPLIELFAGGMVRARDSLSLSLSLALSGAVQPLYLAKNFIGFLEPAHGRESNGCSVSVSGPTARGIEEIARSGAGWDWSRNE